MTRFFRQLQGRRKLNNTGSAMIMALTVISLIAILGFMALSTALLNVKMRNLNRKSDKNFYYLETALDEIYAQAGRMASDILKEHYVQVMGNLYKDGYRTNDEANVHLRTGFIEELAGDDALGITFPQTPENSEENRKNAAAKLASFSDTIQEQNLEVSVDSIILEKTEEDIYSGVALNGVCLVYTNPENGIESALTVDLKIRAPYVRFMNEGDALLNYILAANGDISFNMGGMGVTENHLEGNIYGGSITISQSETDMTSGLITSKGTLTVTNGASLTVSPSVDTGAQSRIWADGILLNFSSELMVENASMFIKDDLTFTEDKNKATLNGSYYGYGNEGDGRDLTKETPNKSSAIIINDRGSTLDMRGLNSLILAGRAYMKFDNTIANGQYVYPMGESLAVKAAQTIYLIPESSVALEWNGKTERPGSNPVPLPEDPEGYILDLHIKLPDEMGGKTADYKVQVNNPEAENDHDKEITLSGPDSEDSPVVPVILNGKIYIYYNFKTEGERKEYFVDYLRQNASSFDTLLQKSRITGERNGAGEENGGIYIKRNENSSVQINTSGALYQVSGADAGDDGHLFQLLEKGENGVSSNIEWITLIGNLDASFQNLQKNLAETDRVGDRASEIENRFSNIYPIGNYVRLDKVNGITDKAVCLKDDDDCSVLLSGDTVQVELNGSGAATVSTLGRTYTMDGGLVVSSGDITVTGDGSFKGLFMAGGNIQVNGNAELSADGQRYEPVLEQEDVAKYFYDYSDVASTVLNDYEDIIIKENWSRSGLERGGEK